MSYFLNKKFWNKKKVFVTGHTGFKGSWLCIFLHLLGAEVTGYSLKPKTRPSLFKQANVKKLIKKSIIADIRDYTKLHGEIKKSNASIVFHLAAQPLVRYSYMNPKETFDTNFTGSLNILESVRKIKTVKTTILITTDKVYENTRDKIFKEDDPLGGRDPYSTSKVCVELLFNSYLRSFFSNNNKRSFATVRAGNVIGGGDYSEDRLVPDIYRYYNKNKSVLIRNRNSTRPWQHVLEPLSGYLLLAQKLYNKKINNINNNWNFGPNISNCKNVNYIAKYFSNKLKFKIAYDIKGKKGFQHETSYLRLSNHKARTILDWYPKWNLNQTLDKIFEWNSMLNKKNALYITKKQIFEYLNSKKNIHK